MAFSRWLSWLTRKPHTVSRRARLSLERLEDRTLPASITWSNPNGGNWDVGANWTGGNVPGSGDDAVINTAAAATITIQNGDNLTVHSVATASTDTLSITGGGLTVTAGSTTLSGPLTMTGGALIATGAGVTAIANGASSVADANLTASAGASLLLPQMTTYEPNVTSFLASGANSVLDVSALSTVTPKSRWDLFAVNGGELKLNGLTNLSSTQDNYNLTDNGGGILLDPNLTTLNGVNVTTDGTDAQLANAWTTFTGGSLTVTGGTYSLPGLTDVDGSNLTVEGGGSLTLAGLKSYDANFSSFVATGVNSVLDLSNLTTVTHQRFASWSLFALNGGKLKVSGLTSVSTTQDNYNLTDTGGGTLLDPNLTTLNGVNFNTDGTDAQVANAWTAFTNGNLTLTAGSYSLPGLTDLDGSSLTVQGGGTLTLPGLKSYDANVSVFEAKGANSLLDLSNLTTVTHQGSWSVNVQNGGELKLNGLTNLSTTQHNFDFSDTAGGKLLDPNLTTLNGVNFTTDGTDAPVASAWTTFTGGSLIVTGGSYSLPGLTDVDGSSLTVQSGGSLTLAGLKSYDANVSFFEATGANSVLDLSNLTTVTHQNAGSWSLFALNGGTLKLSGLTSVSTTQNNYDFTDTGGSKLLDPNLTSLNGVNFVTDGTDTQFANAWSTFTGGNLTLTAGTYSLPSLTDLDGTTVLVQAGVNLTLAGLKSYSSVFAGNGSYLYATGAGSVLNLPALATLTQPGAVQPEVYAANGGAVTLPVLQQSNVTLGNGMSATIHGTLVTLPADKTTGATINVPAAAGVTVTLQNSGTLTDTTMNVGQGGNVVLAGGTYLGGTLFNVAAGAIADLVGPSATTYGGTLSASGSGTVRLAGGAFVIGGNFATAVGGATLNFTGATFQWTSGYFSLTLGDVTNRGTINLAGASEMAIANDGTLDNFGTIIQTGTGNLGLHSDNVTATTLKIEPGATYLLQSDSGIDNPAGGATAVVNAGTISKTGGTGTSTLLINGQLSNTGTIATDSGTLDLNAKSIAQLSGTSLTAGTWNALTGATLQLPTGTNITTNNATIAIAGAGATITGLANLAGNAGSFSLTSGANFTTAADFANSVTLTVGAGSTLHVTSNLTQTSAGTLNVQIGGTPASGLFGQLAVTKAAALAGAFDLALVNGFAPSIAQQFDVLTFASATGNFTSFNGLSPFFTEALTANALALNVVTAPVDLVTSNVSAPTTATAGQQITVSWKVTDQNSAAATGTWQDSVYLSTTPSITSTSILLGAATHTGGLAANASYNGTFAGAIPAVPPGVFYVLVQGDSLYQTPDSNRANNTLTAGTGQLLVSVPALTLGTPLNGAFTAADQDRYYQVSVPAGGSLQVSLTSAASAGAVALYVSAFKPPTPYDYQQGAAIANQPDQTVLVPQIPTPATYYILSHSISGAAASAGFTVTATQTSNFTLSVPPTAYVGGNGGSVTIPIAGTNFSPPTTASLTLGATTLNAASVIYQSASLIYATFNLTGAALGNYNLNVTSASQTVTAPLAIHVVPATATTGTPLELVLTPPSQVRAGRSSDVYVTVTNTTNDNVLAPLLQLTTDAATLKLPSQSGFQGASLYLLATSSTGLAGILTPGESVQVDVEFQSTIVNPTIHFQLNQADDSAPMDWASQEQALRPPSISQAAWSVIFTNFVASMGNTVAGYHAVLTANASYLSELGEPTNDVLQLVEFEIAKANAANAAQTLATVNAANLPTPGKGLIFQQFYLQSISGRYFQGMLGQGWATNWDVSASTTDTGDVLILRNGTPLSFFLQTDGTYQPEIGAADEALSLAGGAYRLLDDDGTVYQFNTNGTLAYVDDANGNRITAAYSNGKLTQLTAANGEYLQLTYNAQGQMVQLKDSNGQTETYGYTGPLLTRYTDAYGATNYTYVNDGTAAQGALAEIAYADNTHLYFSYDAHGRLIDQHRDGGGEDEQFSYLRPGGYTTTDGDGNKTTLLFGLYGTIAQRIDPLNNVTSYKYDANFDRVAVNGPSGTESSYTYDAVGNLSSETTPLGQTTFFTHDTNNDLTSFTDANGNTTSYAYDNQRNVMSVTYPNGASQQYTYNPLGEATLFVNANGNAIANAYDADGLLAKETFADGTSLTYATNSYEKITSATDRQGNVTKFFYANAGNPILLTEVLYSDGTYLKFSYNVVGQRTQSVDQTGFTVNYAYDALGRLSELTDGSGNRIVSYSYDAAGNLIQKDNGNSTRTVYTYDPDRNVLSITNFAANHVTVNSYDNYTYDARGNELTDTNQDGQWAYTYDADNQLIGAVFAPNGTNPDGLSAENLQYVYDAVGNRISETANGVATIYVANNVNEYTSRTTAGVGTTTYKYDADGNLVSTTDATGNITTNSFNELDQLTGISNSGLTASYVYNPFGSVISQTVNGVKTNYQIDPIGLANITAAYDGNGNLLTRFIYGFGLVSQPSATGVVGYYDFNSLGSTIGISNSVGQYVNKYTYLPFGQTTAIQATLSNPFTFVGRLGVSADANGMFDMRFRVYDPSTGQFLSNDPEGLRGGDVNLRRYVGNNPLREVDPRGLCGGTPERCKGNEGLFYQLCIWFGWFQAPPGGYTLGKGDPADASGGGAGDGGCPCHYPSPTPPKPPGKPGPGGSTDEHLPGDPNALIGPAGYGTPKFIVPSGNGSYITEFQNDGTAAAQQVIVTEQFDANLDWSTVQLGSFGFGPIKVSIPAGLTEYQTTVAYQNANGTPLSVLVALNFNVQTGFLKVTFTSLDPATGVAPPGVFDGFLPPDNTSAVGEGFVQYTVKPKVTLATGATINQQAAVVFDTNAPIDTNTVTNTIDAVAPASSVTALPLKETSPFIPLSWSGTDDAGGSGIASYDILVSDNGGPFTAFLTATTQTSATFTGFIGHTYGFYSVATDNAGNVEATPSAARATTTVTLPPEFVYDPSAKTLAITLTAALPIFQFSQVTTVSGGVTSTNYTFALSGSAPTVSESFTDAQLTTTPGAGASVTVTGQGLAGPAILITNDTYLDQNNQKQETPERLSLGSLTDAGVGTMSKFVGNSLNNPSYTFMSLKNFPISYAYAGRADGTIMLQGTQGTGKVGFVTAGYYSYIAAAVTGLYAHFGEGTPNVVGTSAGNAADFAYHYTSSATSTISTITSVFTVNGIMSSSMSGSQTNPEDGGAIDTFNNLANGFVLNTAVSYTGNSIAHINDSPLSDTYVAQATDPLGLGSIGGVAGFSYMYVGAFPAFGEFDVAYGFGTYYATATNGGRDIDYPGAPANNVFSSDWIQAFS